MLLKHTLAHHFERLVLIWADGGYAGQVSLPDPIDVIVDQALELFWEEQEAKNAARDSSTPASPVR